MTNILLILLFLIVFIVFFSLSFFRSKRYKSSSRRTNISVSSIPLEEEINPDINTLNWDLHKQRLEKFRRSQYKGLTFFLSSEDKIYYLSENRKRVYC